MIAKRAMSLLAATALIAGIGASACGKKPKETPSPTPEPVAETTQAAPTTTPAPTKDADPWPLTGLPGPPENRPALSIKIENSPAARPQAGLEEADIVWEEVVEGGIARFVATFHSSIPDEVGPVRSVRPMDGPIAGATDGLLVFSGGQYRFIQQAVDAGLQVLGNDQGAAGFFREPSRSGEHSLFGRPPEFLDQADDDHVKSPPSLFFFAADAGQSFAAKQGQAVKSVAFRLSAAALPDWTWDPKDKVWLRSENGEPAMAASEVQLSAVNVVSLKVDVTMAGGRDAAGSPIPEMMVVGSGDALVASAGKAIEVTWEKKSPSDPVVLTGPDGEKVTLAPGNTWVELMPVHDGSWTLIDTVSTSTDNSD
ncbi:MAG: DUF3048 domain-containing protein [Micrococcales bacterium]|nr:DUF3048 domain-containing protein [Micrococcales bacterium]